MKGPKCIYIAARYSRKNEMREHAAALRGWGYDITSSWLAEAYDPNITLDQLTLTENSGIAQVDLDDIVAADVMLFFAEDPLVGIPRGGRHFEHGFAYAQGLEMFVIGPKENIFHYMPNMKHYETFKDFLKGEVTNVG